MYVVIMAGGKGTRISSVANDIPKPMIPVCGKPVLQHQIEKFAEYGYRDFILVTGYLREKIKEFFGDGSKFGVKISYFEETDPLGTAGALPFIKDKLCSDFFMVNGDLMFDVDLNRFLDFHKQKKSIATIMVHPNSHPYDSALVVSDENGTVTEWLHKEDRRPFCKNLVNAGIHIISRKIFEVFPAGKKKVDLDRDVLIKLIPLKGLYAYYSPEYITDMGTPERYYKVCDDFATGFIAKKNLVNKQKAVFLDRDGTINKYKGFITRSEELELINDAAEAIKAVNAKGYLAIVITNQPVIARGECSFEELQKIHNKLETLLGEKGAYINAIYFCPHHPDKGFEGERQEYKIKCVCRKPEPGMLLKAARDFNIDLCKSWMIGDSKSDVMAGKNAGCKTAYLCKENEAGVDADIIVEKISDFANMLESI